MNEIDFVDVTIRDGHQSLWATRMTAAMMLPIAPIMDRAGFKYIEVGSMNHFVAYARYLKENPWEKLRLQVKAMPKTPVYSAIRSRGIWNFGIEPDSVIALFVRRMAAHGIRRLGIFDPLHDFPNIYETIRVAKEEGLEVELTLVFSLSPVHTAE